MKLISWWGGGKIDQPLISGDKIVEFGIAVQQYYDANLRLVECLNSDCYVRQPQREGGD